MIIQNIFLLIITIIILLLTEFELQTKNLLAALNQTLKYGLPILESDRLKLERLSLKLRSGLNNSTIESGRSVLPRDLETTATFVELVAK